MSVDTAALARIAGTATLGYIAVLVLIRLLGKRTISSMNPSDFAVTVAVGSTLAALITSKDLTIAQGVAALATLLLLQFATEWLTTRFRGLRGIIEGRRTLVYYRGKYIRDAMRREHVNEREIRMAMRREGLSEAQDVGAVVLEIDGSLSVVPALGDERSSLRDTTR